MLLERLFITQIYQAMVFSKNFFGEGILYAPCFSIYNAIELMPYKDIYDKFIDFFA